MEKEQMLDVIAELTQLAEVIGCKAKQIEFGIDIYREEHEEIKNAYYDVVSIESMAESILKRLEQLEPIE